MFTKNKGVVLLCHLVMVMFLFLYTGTAYAKVAGMCGNCHTMHNSQGGAHMMINETIDGTGGGDHNGSYPALTRGTCVGCHTGTNVSGGAIPFVFDTGTVTYGTDTLAGGNFKWVVDNDAKGHNVKGIPNMTADGQLSMAPGNIYSCDDSCHNTLFAPKDVGVVLNTGCQGCHLAPKHHAPQQAVGDPVLAVNGYFRFLSGHVSGTGRGVEGIEDNDWQLTNSATDHNEYLGLAGTKTGTGGFGSIGGNTMTAYCTGCHGNFHVQQDANAAWVRHPSDAVLPNTGEYTAYTIYDPNVPVARPDFTIADVGAVDNNEDMVMCLSCHRAHGSPYDDMLRWEYSGMVAGGGANSTGCFVCHSEKDE